MKIKAENGTFGHLIFGETTKDEIEKRPCPVCCESFGRDRDMCLTRTPEGEKFFVCESNKAAGDEYDCGFAVPANFSQRQTRRLAENRKQYLRFLKISGVIGGEV